MKKSKENIIRHDSVGIYCIKNKISGKCYVGKSSNIKNRWEQHIYSLKAGKGKRKLQIDWDLYGEENFEFFILELFEFNQYKLDERESYWANKLDVWDKGYNEVKLIDYSCINTNEIIKYKEDLLNLFSKHPGNLIRLVDICEKFSLRMDALIIIYKNITESEMEKHSVFLNLNVEFSYQHPESHIKIISWTDYLKRQDEIKDAYLNL